MNKINSRISKISVTLFCLFASYFNVALADTIIKKVNVEVVSGTYAGQTGEAIFSYDTDRATGNGLETIEGNGIEFKFLGQIVTGKPNIELLNGQFKDVLWVAKLQNQEGRYFNFGFNSGFNRGQFGRPEEAFIPQGRSYFAYLGPNTIVDGAGVIQYIDSDRRVQKSPRRIVSSNVLEFSIDNQSLKFMPQDFNKLSLELNAGQKPALFISLKGDQVGKLRRLTGSNLGKRVHVSLNGKEFSAPIIRSSLGGDSMLTGVPLQPAMKFLEEFSRTMQ